MSCCILSKFPKKYLVSAKTEDNKTVNFFVNTEVYLKIRKVLKKYPDSKLIVYNEIKNEKK